MRIENPLAGAPEHNPQLKPANCNRLIQAHFQKANQKVEGKNDFSLLAAIPIEDIRAAAAQAEGDDGLRLHNFLEQQWNRLVN